MNINDHLISVSQIEFTDFDQDHLIGGRQANFSKHFNLQRLGIHHYVLPAGYRTSLPHAESLEEEFVFVISGEVDLWCNGKIKKMTKGDAVGFPILTGDGHTFINNSKDDVVLFVVGERTKKENQCHFHLHPEKAKEMGDFWWAEAPPKKLGGHHGLPGPYPDTLNDPSIKVLSGYQAIPAKADCYYGTEESFGHGTCLSRPFGLSKIAVWLEKLPPGKKSSWPHAHSSEEEFVFILEGEAHLWLNGAEFIVKENHAIDFKAGSGVAHTLINKSEKDLYYLCVGEC